jgi:large subunit ribosomal protein L10
MPTQAKAEKIEVLTEKLSRASIVILVQTQGMSVKDMNDLRGKMRAAKLELQVTNMTELDKNIFNGQTTVAFGYDDEVAAAKAVNDYIQGSRVAVLKSAILGGRALSADDVTAIAKIPGGKNQTKAQVVGTIQGPLNTTFSLLTAPLRDLCYVLQARAEQINGEPVTE